MDIYTIFHKSENFRDCSLSDSFKTLDDAVTHITNEIHSYVPGCAINLQEHGGIIEFIDAHSGHERSFDIVLGSCWTIEHDRETYYIVKRKLC